MVYSFIGLGKPIAAVNNILKTHIQQYRKQNRDFEPPLCPGGIFASDLSKAAAFAGDNDMCVYMSIEDLLQKSDIIFMFLSDKALKNISVTLGKHLVKGKIFCHFSPAFSAGILDFNSSNTYLSMYLPYFTKDDAGRSFSKRIIAEGYGKNADKLKNIFEELSIDISFISAEERLMYLTAVNIVKDMPVVLKYTAQRLAKYALASHGELCDELTELMAQTPSELNSYNGVDAMDADFVLRQCNTLKSLGINDITNLFCSLAKISSQLSQPSEALEKIAAITKRTMGQK